jgi:methyl-accepting chemotaxis protein
MLLFKANQNVKNLYTFIKQDDKTALFVIDASPDPAGFPEEYDMEPEMLNTFDGNITVCDKIYTDELIAWKNSSASVEEISASSEEIAASTEVLSASQWTRA